MSTQLKRQSRSRRQARPTPSGEARRGLQDARVRLSELEELDRPGANADLEKFVSRFNDFLRAARAVPHFLRKELGRNAGWVRQEEKQLAAADARYNHFCELRDVPAHDCIVRPDSTKQSVEVIEQMRLRGSVEGFFRDPLTGAPTAHFSHVAPVDADSGLFEQTRVRVRYYMKDWPQEDVTTFCKEALASLSSLVERAYKHFP